MLDRMDRSFFNFAISLYIPSFFIQLGYGLVSPIMPIYAKSFGVDYAMVALVTTVNAVGRLLSDVPLGAVSDRIGRKPLSVLGPLIITVSALLSAFAGSFYELLVYRFFTGIAMSMWMVARSAMIAESIHPSIRGRVMSTFQGVNMIGTTAGPAVGGIVAQLWGIRAPFLFYGGSTFVSLLTSLAFIKETNPSKRGSRDHVPKVGLRQVAKLFTFPVIMAAFANFVNFIRFAARSVVIPLFAADVLNLSPGEIGLVLSASTMANLVMVTPAGYIVDKFGRKKGLVPAFLMTGLVFALYPSARDFTSITLYSVLLGIASGLGGGATQTMAADLAPEGYRGFFLGFWTTIGDLGSAIGPVALGIVADVSGLKMPFYVLAGLMLTASATTQLFVRETLKTRPFDHEKRQ